MKKKKKTSEYSLLRYGNMILFSKFKLKEVYSRLKQSSLKILNFKSFCHRIKIFLASIILILVLFFSYCLKWLWLYKILVPKKLSLTFKVFLKKSSIQFHTYYKIMLSIFTICSKRGTKSIEILAICCVGYECLIWMYFYFSIPNCIPNTRY